MSLRVNGKNYSLRIDPRTTLGVPALFHRSCADELLHLDEGSGAKAVIASNHERVTEFIFPEGKIDIDTAAEADYDRLHVSED